MPGLSPANDAKLHKLMTKFKVQHLAPWIVRHATECVLLHVDKPDKYKKKGNTRIGGVPDLPTSIEWPRGEDGLYFTFVLQLDLGQLPTVHASPLPTSGRLYLFVGCDQTSGNVHHKLIFNDSPVESLCRASPPADDEMANEDVRGLKPHTVKCELGLSLPKAVFSEQWRDPDLDEKDEAWDQYSEMQESLRSTKGEPPSQLLGYPSSFDRDPARTTYYSQTGRYNVEHETLEALEENIRKAEADGRPDWIAGGKQLKDDFLWYGAHRSEIDASVKEWTMLLQVESNMDVGLSWWDAGAVHVMIREADLRLGRFDQTHVTLSTH